MRDAAWGRTSAAVEGALEGGALLRIEGRAGRGVVIAAVEIARRQLDAPLHATVLHAVRAHGRDRERLLRVEASHDGEHLLDALDGHQGATHGRRVAEAGRVPRTPLAHLADAVERAEEVDQQPGVTPHEVRDLAEARLRRRRTAVEDG